jgi:hypothetical protein
MAARLVKKDAVFARREDDGEDPARRIHGLEEFRGLGRSRVDDPLEGILAGEEVATESTAALST